MFRKAKDKLTHAIAQLEDRAELMKLRSHVEMLEKSHDIVLKELQRALGKEEVEFPILYAERYAHGLREGYQTGFADGVYQYQIELVKQFAAQGIEFSLEDWDV